MFTRVYKRYVLAILTLVCTLNYLDQGLIALLLQPIKDDLRLSDTQLGFLTGMAFALFYATLGLPIARWADCGNRVTVTSIAIGIWGCAVMLCLFVTNFLQLIVARIAAAVGESGCTPPTYSLLGDYFPGPTERTRAMAIYWVAGPLAALISFTLGGWINELYGWRVTFSVMGIPGLLAAVVVKMTVAETRTYARDVESLKQATPPSWWSVLGTLWRQRSTRHLMLALTLLYTMGSGLAPWYAAFMMRSHDIGTGELGIWFGVIFGISGGAGTCLGGYVAARWFANNERGQMRMSALTIASVVPCCSLSLFLPQKEHALIALLPFAFAFNCFFGPTFALLQRLVSDDMRATTLAVMLLLANLIGMGIGPAVVGILSDLLRPVLGSDSLRYAMLAMSSIALWSACHFWQVGRTVRGDLTAAERRNRFSASSSVLRGDPLHSASWRD